MAKTRVKNTFYATFEPDKYEIVKDLDYDMLNSYFCRSEEEIKAEEIQKKK
jgi:hypothetical protein